MRTLDNIVIYDNYERIDSGDVSTVRTIASKTMNTWQSDRDEKEKLKNTLQGKKAEAVIKNHIISKTSYSYLSYDDFRDNQYEKHAPFDGLLFNKNTSSKTINPVIAMIRFEVSKNNYGLITPEARSIARKCGLYVVEVKSTRVSEKKRKVAEKVRGKGNVESRLIEEIKNDDYLTYPHAIRHSNIRNSIEYLSYLRNKGLIKSSKCDRDAYNEMKAYEIPHMSDLYFRVYLDTISRIAYIIGFITRHDFFSIYPPLIKKMVFPGKSEGAIYLALPIRKGRSISDLYSTLTSYSEH